MKSSNARSSGKNHLAVNLATQLQAVGDLTHLGFADFFATAKDLAFTVGAANNGATLADAREYRIAIGTVDEVARTRTAEVFDRRVEVVSERGLGEEREDDKQ